LMREFFILLMKTFLFFVLTLYSFVSYTQTNLPDSPIDWLEKVLQTGVLLDKGWKFQAGDNPDYAKRDYDDNKWQSINPTLDIHDLPQISKSGIGWFRLHLSTGSSVNSHLAMMIQQSGASEIYLNGHLIQRFGILSADPEKVIAYDPLWKPILLSI